MSLLLSLAEAKDWVAEGNFPLKQERGETPHAQGDDAGECLYRFRKN